MIVSIVNQQGHNYGDEAAGCALVQELLKIENVRRINIFYASDSEIPIYNDIVFHYTDLTLKKMGLKAIIRFLCFFKGNIKNIPNDTLRKTCLLLSESNIVFVSPCGASIGIYKDWRYLLRLLITIKCGKTLIFHYNTIGRSNNVIFDNIAKYILKKSIVYVREKASYDFLKNIGIKAMLGPDSAFLLPLINSSQNKEVAFIPAHLDDWHPFFKHHHIDKFVNEKIIPLIVQWCKLNSLSVKIVPHFNLKSEIEYCNYIKDLFINFGLSKDYVNVCPNVNSYKDYDLELANSRFVLGMRYHAIVLAAKNSIPFLAFAYENKMKEVSCYMCQESYCIDLTYSKQNSLIEDTRKKLNDLIKNEISIKNILLMQYYKKNKEAKVIVEKYCNKVIDSE